MAKLEDPCPFCNSIINYYPTRTFKAEKGIRVECYCSNIKCDLKGLRTLTDHEYRKLLATAEQPKPPKP